MHFPISGTDISPVYLVIVGFLIGILGGFFGVGGSFIAGPALRAVGMHWNYAVGTDLAHIVGKSVVAAKRHRALGNVDLRLGFIMALGTIAGAEMRRAVDSTLEARGATSTLSSASFRSRSTAAFPPSWSGKAGRRCAWKRSRAAARKRARLEQIKDVSSFSGMTSAIHRIPLWPMISLPTSGVKSISLWVIVLRLVHWRTLQRFSRRRRRLHPDADDGLCPRNSDPSRGRDRSL